jgi:hypothetical protein
MENSEYEIFKAIVDFIIDLDSVYGTKHKSISLYRRLVSKMSIVNIDPIRKHIAVFTKFCSENKSALESGDLGTLSQPLLKYSDRVFVQLDTVVAKSDSETNKIILKHLLTINALINSTDKSALALLSTRGNDTDDVLSDLINTVTESIDPTSTDPMSAVMGLISSGKFTNMVSSMARGVASGSVNPEAMLKKVTSMYMQVTQDDKDAPDINTIISTVTKSIS